MSADRGHRSEGRVRRATRVQWAAMYISGRTIAAVCGVAVLIVLAVIAVPKFRKTKVWVVNGLEVAVVAEVDGHRVDVGPQSRAAKVVRGRSIEIVVRTQDGKEIDREDIDASTDKVVFNVLAATSLAIEGKLYNFHGLTTYEPRPAENLLGERVVDRGDDIDFYFEAPSQIPQPEDAGPGPVEKRVLRVEGGWSQTVDALIRSNQPNAAHELVKQVAAVQPANPRAVELLAELQRPHERAEQARRAALNPPIDPNRPKNMHDWVLASADGQAKLIHDWVPPGTCAARCERGGSAVWRAQTCLGTTYQARFVAPDCSRVVVVQTASLDGADASTKQTVFVYVDGALAESHTPAEYLGDSAVPDDGMWLFGKPRLGTDGRSVELVTRDQKIHHIALVR